MVADIATSGHIPAATVADAVAGDAMAFARIVRAHHDDMVRVCQVICGDPDLAQDATQAAWPIVWRKLGSLREPDRLRSWLVSVAANEARQLIRRRRRDRVVAIELANLRSDESDPAWRSADDELVSAIRRLPVDDRTPLRRRVRRDGDRADHGHLTERGSKPPVAPRRAAP
jgi:RNA polymerase sigma factor (sigma-70 family)